MWRKSSRRILPFHSRGIQWQQDLFLCNPGIFLFHRKQEVVGKTKMVFSVGFCHSVQISPGELSRYLDIDNGLLTSDRPQIYPAEMTAPSIWRAAWLTPARNWIDHVVIGFSILILLIALCGIYAERRQLFNTFHFILRMRRHHNRFNLHQVWRKAKIPSKCLERIDNTRT